MNWNKLYFRTLHRVMLTAIVGTSAILAAEPQTNNQPAADLRSNDEVTTFVVEIKEHAATNRQNNVNPAQDPAIFSRGDTFVVTGTIYVDGSIPAGHKREPIAGAQTLGTYVQRGVFTEEFDQFQRAIDGARDVASTISFTTEVLIFDDGSTILIDGLWPNAYFSTNRVVQGGTGRYRDAIGTVLEENIGEDLDTFCNLRLTFKIRKAGGGGRDH